uniref:NADH dehydrogenase subunit 6 n=1 Tax=Chilocorus rubidus TaxID=419958 RepID=UPI00286D0203|nr:NADH dehydrogenase subunit 6 [Chilocorus rubidus]WMB96367.1 NADH dehydrogenase subunit 6 [Chilocorus rubidus]
MLMMLISLMTIFLKHPLSMGILILTQTILICLNMGFMSVNFWFSYILILVMIGGLLILFIYMTSIASNEKFLFSMKLFMMFMIILTMLILFMKMDFKTNNFFNKNILTQNIILNDNFYYSMSKFYIFPSMKILIMIILYLLITMIAVVKICKTSNGPLRQMFYENSYTKNKSNKTN